MWSALPLAARIGATLAALLLFWIFAVGCVGGDGAPQQPAAASAQPQHPAAAPADSAVAQRMVPTAASATPAALGSLQVVLPGQPKPMGLQSNHVAYALSFAPTAAWTGKLSGPWASLGSAVLPATASSFTTLPSPGLAGDLPGDGATLQTWRFWWRASTSGRHVVVLQIANTAAVPAAATLTVDAQVKPVTTVNADDEGNHNAIAAADLGAGWHRLVVTLQQPVAASRGRQTTVNVFVRGPSASQPVDVTPWAAVPTAKPASAASAAASPRGGTRAIPMG